jgi:hypothetical protein
MSHVAIPRTIDSLLTRAVATGEIETLSAAELADASGTPFGGTPATVLALPIVIAGEPCAVVYADDADQRNRELGRPELRTKFAELVCEHAAPLLMWLSNAEQALAELREYATLLLTELEYTWAGDISAARPDAERRKRLAESLDCARQLFAERARPHGPRAPGLFDERLASLIDARRATPFGRDLAALVGRKGTGGALSPREAAEAS